MKKAMITIEVLVSMLILFLVISTSFSNIKFFNTLTKKQEVYEEQYMTVLSLKDKLSLTLCKTTQKLEGEFNRFDYIATCTKIKELKTYMMASEDDEVSGNRGAHKVKLYRVNLTLTKERLTKEYNYYKTVTQKLSSW